MKPRYTVEYAGYGANFVKFDHLVMSLTRMLAHIGRGQIVGEPAFEWDAIDQGKFTVAVETAQRGYLLHSV